MTDIKENNTMANKMTKKDYYNAFLAKYPLTEDEQKFVKNELDLLEKKNASKKPTAQQIANETYKSAIYEFLSANPNKRYTITELIKEVSICNSLTNQRVSAIVRSMQEANLVKRVEDKRKAYFTLA
jgi:predicted transcriptional regulator